MLGFGYFSRLRLNRLVLVACFIFVFGLVGKICYGDEGKQPVQKAPVQSPSASPGASSGSLPQSSDFQSQSQGGGVGLYTGDMNLPIPLFTVPGRGGLDYPIVLGYKAGIKVDQQASWIGLGWDLNPGAVSRNVINYPDDYGSSSSGNPNVQLNIVGETFNRSCGGFLYTEGTHTHNDFEGRHDYISGEKVVFSVGGKSGSSRSLPDVSGDAYLPDPSYTAIEPEWNDRKPENDNLFPIEGGWFHFEPLKSRLRIHFHIKVDDYYRSGSLKLTITPKGKKPYSEIYPCDGESPDLYSLSGEQLILTGKPGSRKFNLQRTPGLATSSTTIDDAIKIEYATDSTTGAITRFVATMKDGTRQVYSYPLRIKDQVSTFVSKDGKKTITSFKKPYTYAWRLTAILSPDYVDANKNGIPDGDDKGNWIRFEYAKDTTDTDWYHFRTPYDGGYTDGPFGGEMAVDGYMELAHLERIITPTHIAYFDVAKDRRDGKEYLNKRLVRLQEVKLYTKDSFNSYNTSDGIIRSVSFSHNYSLRHKAPWCDLGYGELTLESITMHGKGGKAGGYSFPPTVFEYATGDNNPDWDKYKWDRWGYYCGIATKGNHNLAGELTDFAERITYIRPQAWSLTKIIYPTGGSTEWEYEPDSYSSPRKEYGGGIRVKSVITYDGLEKKYHARRFFYNKGDTLDEIIKGESSGATPIAPPPFKPIELTVSEWKRLGGDSHFWLDGPLYKMDDLPFGSAQSSSGVGYSQVTEVPGWDKDKPNAAPYGYIVHNFNNPETHPNEGNSKQYDLEFKRGLEVATLWYDSQQVLKKRAYANYSFPTQAMWESSKDVLSNESKERLISGWPRLENVTTEEVAPLAVDGLPAGVSYEYNPINGLATKETAPVVMIPADIPNNSFEKWNGDKPASWSGNGMLETKIIKEGARAILCGTKTISADPPETISLMYEIQDSSGNPLISSTASVSTKSWEYYRITLPPTIGQRIKIIFKAEGGIISSGLFPLCGDSINFYAQGYWERPSWGGNQGTFTKGVLIDCIKGGTYYSPEIDEKQRITEIEYVYPQYSQMKSTHILTSVGTTSIKKADGSLIGLSVTTYNAQLYPLASYIWLDSMEQPNGKVDTGELICTSRFPKYDAYGNLLQVVDANNGTTTYFYGDNALPTATTKSDGTYENGSQSAHAYLTCVQNSLGHTAATYYLNDGSVGTVTDANRNNTIYLYDEFGRLKKVIRPGDSLNSPTMEYDYYYALFQGPLGYLLHEKKTPLLASPSGTKPQGSLDNLPDAPEPPSANLNRITTWQKINENTRQEIRKWYDGLGRLIRTEAEVSNKATVGTEGWVWKEDKWGGCGLDKCALTQGKISLETYAVYGGDNNLTVENINGNCSETKKFNYTLSLTDSSFRIYKWNPVVQKENGGNDNGSKVNSENTALNIKVYLQKKARGYKKDDRRYKATYYIYGKKDLYYLQGAVTSQPILCGDVATWGYLMVNQELNGQKADYILQSSDDGKAWGQEVPVNINSSLVPVTIPEGLAKKKWIRWKAYLSGTTDKSPVIKGIAINWKTNTDDDIVTDVTYNTLGLQDRVYSPYVELDKRGKSTEFVYENNPLGRVSKVINPDGGSVSTIYSVDGKYQVVTVIDENGRYTKTKYDRLGNMRIKEQETEKGVLTTTYEYDMLGNLIKVTDSGNNITGYQYDTLNRLIKKIHPDTGATEYRYDNNGKLRFKRDASHYQQRIWVGYQYDKLNRLTQKGIVSYSGDYPSDTISLDAKTSYTYDGDGTYAPPRLNMNCSKGNLTQMKDESGTTTYFYDNRGRLRCQQRRLSGKDYSTWYEYDAGDNLIQITNPAEQIATYTYNHLSQLASIRGDKTGTISYTYESSGSIDVVTFPNGITTNYDYTARNWTNIINTMKGTASVFQRYYQYDPGGNITQEYNAATKTSLFSKYTYDKLNRLTGADYQPVDIFDLLYTYDNCGNRIKAAVGTAIARNYSYSGNRITSDGVYNYTYYPNGNLKTKAKTGELFEYYYDYANNLIQINKNGGVLERYVYDGDGRRVEKLSNGATNTAVSTYIYGSGVQVIYEERFLIAKKMGAPSVEKDWEKAGLWHLTTTRSNGSGQAWCYNNGKDYNIGNNSGVLLSPAINLTGFSDPILRFSSWYQTEDENVWWDQKKVFISTEGGRYKDLQQVKQISGTMNQWAEQGVTLDNYTGKKIRLNFLFDTRDGLYNNYEGWYVDNVRIEEVGGQKSPKILLSSKGSGEVIVDVTSYSIDKAIASSRENTTYLYANGQMVAKVEEQPVGSVVKVYYYHNDYLGSPRAITATNGAIVWRQDCYPFGSVLSQSGTTDSLFTFTGKELDDTGLFYFGARYYEPGLGRFISPDPVQPPGRNLFIYCHNNPLGYVDPNGENPLAIIGAIVSIYAGVSTAINIADAYQHGGAQAAFEVGLVSFVTWGITSGINFGDGIGASIAEGAVRGGISGGFMSAAGGGDFEKGMWQGAAWGAGMSAVGWGVEKLATARQTGQIKKGKYEHSLITPEGRVNDAIELIKMSGEERLALTLDNMNQAGNIRVKQLGKTWKKWEVWGEVRPWEPNKIYLDIDLAMYGKLKDISLTLAHEYVHVIQLTGKDALLYNMPWNWGLRERQAEVGELILKRNFR